MASPAYSPTTYSLRYDCRPWLMNEDKRLHPMARHRLIREWKDAFAWLCRSQHVPALPYVAITVIHHRRNRASMPDHCAVMPAYKAALDGVVSAGVLPNDSPRYLESVTFAAPAVTGRDALELVIYPKEISV